MSIVRAHMVTRAYLEAWGNERGMVHVWDAESRISMPQTLKNATVVGDVYQTEHTTLDLEADYGKIESRAAPALRNLAQGGTLREDGKQVVIEFLDMFLERGRYADQAKVRVPIAAGDLFKGTFEMTEMGLGDRLTLSRDIDKESPRLKDLRVDRWPWRIGEVQSGLVTGDGAVLMFNKAEGAGVQGVLFPLSPTRILALGELPDSVNMINSLVVSRSRRWLIDRVDGFVARSVR